jgi:tRNA-binding EMAP/Myf-like protein
METISFDEFKKVDIRIGKIISAERVKGSDKLLKLTVDFGLEPLKPEPAGQWIEVPESEPKPIIRQIVAGIGRIYLPESLIGKKCPFVFNLAPRNLKGLESQGMILCPDNNGDPSLMHPDRDVPPGSMVK